MTTLTALVDAAITLADTTNDRILLGLSGAPGAGKSTLAWHLAAALTAAGVPATRVPMDGFHLSDAQLAALGRRERKGALDTFDGWGYLALLQRLRTERDHVVYAPEFDRTLEQPLAAGLAVAPDCHVVITEGNYLLAPAAPWSSIRHLVHEIWHCDLDDAERRHRLIERHQRFGKSAQAAADWVAQVDEANARQVNAWAPAATRRIDVAQLGLPPGRD
ncbi:MAG: nucleoside/nucleotide kinase family protein [Propionibacteriaceae bacterium]|jgi:pantothenate kinase|nr:nucleoside/nucleotide kinase family protein [Propionibacteriaceae bacterium]